MTCGLPCWATTRRRTSPRRSPQPRFLSKRDTIYRLRQSRPGAREVSWPGRFEVFNIVGKTVVADGAHNPYSIRRLVENLRDYVEFDGVALVYGALGGHSARDMLKELAVLDPRVVAVHSRHPRSSHSSEVANVVRGLGLNLVARFESVAEGFRHAVELAGPDELVLCTGSLAVVAETLEEIRGIEPEIYENLKGPRARN